jgi:hypothetical protein
MPGRSMLYMYIVFQWLSVGNGSWERAVAPQYSLPREALERAQSLTPRRLWSGAIGVDKTTHVAPPVRSVNQALSHY